MITRQSYTPPTDQRQRWDSDLRVYNALDVTVTKELWDVLDLQMDEHARRLYSYTKAMTAVALQMMLRGVRIDFARRAALTLEYEAKLQRLGRVGEEYGKAILGRPMNLGSPAQVSEALFDVMELPTRNRSTEREALEKLGVYKYAEPLVAAVLEYRDLDKCLNFLYAKLDDDGRLRCSFNVVGTETGRWSSSTSAFGRGTNLQNIRKDLRAIMVPDPGMTFVNADLEQAEARCVAYLSNDPRYIEACESGDLHTTTASMIWGFRAERELAERPFFRHFSYRDTSKRGGHLLNYLGGMAALVYRLRLPRNVALGFEHDYFVQFPGIRDWQTSTLMEVQRNASRTGPDHGPYLDTPLGRRRYFQSNINAAKTHGEIIAHGPQSMIADLANIGIYRCWSELESRGVQVLLQGHDAGLFQVPTSRLTELIPQIKDLMSVEFTCRGAKRRIPVGIKCGLNASEYDKKKHPDVNALQEYGQWLKRTMTTTRTTPTTSP